jgi:tetratricopeptide (TPR) repeat protein
MVEARNLLANLYIASGKYDLAIEQCRVAMRDDPSDQTAIYHLIVALRHTPGDAAHNEIPALVKQLAQLQQSSLQQETDRKRFSLVEQKASAPQ